MKGSLTINKRKITYLMFLVTLLTFFSGCNNKIVDEKTYAYADNYGYELFDVELWVQSYVYIEGVGSFTGGNIYYFINNQKVEVTGIYNDEMGIYEYNNPGVPINEKTLKIEE